MGTNFYRKGKTNSDDPKFHLGKRSAAGLYCWDCKITLCKGGEEGIHYSKYEWHDKCPKCGNKASNESISEGAAGKELGFNKGPLRRTGVSSICSFTWGVEPDSIKRLRFVEDEYKRISSMDAFREILKDCPVQYKHLMGQEFI